MRRRKRRRGLSGAEDVHRFHVEEAASKATHYADKVVQNLKAGQSCRRVLSLLFSAERQRAAMVAHRSQIKPLRVTGDLRKKIERAEGDVAEAHFVFDGQCFPKKRRKPSILDGYRRRRR